MAAMEAEFPDDFKDAHTPKAVKDAHTPKVVMGMGMKGQKKNQSEESFKRKADAVGINDTPLPWRSQLGIAYARKHKGVTKDAIIYATEELGDKPPYTYQSTVSSDQFESTHTGEPANSKRNAEDNAAMAAMEAEFPDDFVGAHAPKAVKEMKGQKKKSSEESLKRKADAGSINVDPKSRLNSSMMLVSGQSMQKGFIEYTAAQEGNMT